MVVIDELELRQIATVDQLSGAMNRRAWMESSEKEVERARRYERPLSLAMLDLDRFKTVNDTYGHPAGDIVIGVLGGICISQCRQTDFFGRLGGEEFAILMPETSLEDAQNMAERCRLELAETDIDIGEKKITVTTSIGLAELRPGEDLSSLISRADAALYDAKDSGRNRTALAPETDPVD